VKRCEANCPYGGLILRLSCGYLRSIVGGSPGHTEAVQTRRAPECSLNYTMQLCGGSCKHTHASALRQSRGGSLRGPRQAQADNTYNDVPHICLMTKIIRTVIFPQVALSTQWNTFGVKRPERHFMIFQGQGVGFRVTQDVENLQVSADHAGGQFDAKKNMQM
jgi:hypothetical protein